MSNLETRVVRLEQKRPGINDPFAHLSDEELEARIFELEDKLVASVEAGEPIPEMEPGLWDRILADVAKRGRRLVSSEADA